MITLHLDEQRGWRGGEQQAYYLIRGLAARGHTVLVAARPGGEFSERLCNCPDVRLTHVPFFTEWDVFSALRLAKHARKRGVELIHAHTSRAHSIACLTKLFCPHVKVVVTRRVDFKPRRNYWTRWKYNYCDFIVPISKCIQQVLEEFGVDARKMRVIYSAQDTGRLEQAPISLGQLGIPDDSRVLLCPAALVGHKDHATLLNAMPMILREYPNVHLLLAGDGELKSTIERQITKLGIERHVHLLGYRRDVPALMKSAEVFVLSSKMEGLGSTIIEAMFCRLPVVACSAGGIPELVKHEETGLLVCPGDSFGFAQAVIRVLKEKDFAYNLALRAHEFAEGHFRVEQMVSRYEALYDEILKK